MSLCAAGVALLIGGVYLVAVGGSGYYAIAGIACGASGYLTIRKRRSGVTVFALTVVVTVVWAVWEVGLDAWALVPRLLGPAVIFGLLALLSARFEKAVNHPGRRRYKLLLATTAALLLLVALGAAFEHRFRPAAPRAEPDRSARLSVENGEDWHGFGGGNSGLRYSAASQINAGNVAQLEPAWTFRTGHRFPPDVFMGADEVTPTKVGDTLYLCTPDDVVIALDAGHGTQKWRFDPGVPEGRWKGFSICRGVTYFKSDNPDREGRCLERLALATLDFRLIALDARDGRVCRGFGTNGVVDLSRGFERLPPGSVAITSPPTFLRNKLVVGHFVMDNQRTDGPSGVIRAYDAVDGSFLWAWDMEVPDRIGEPAEGQTYTRGTPNAWSAFAADEKLNLVYLPTGNAGADYFGGHRSAVVDHYSSSVVALDGDTGRPRWSFQAVHHDVWDYDVAAQPVLIDLEIEGRAVPALVQGTKTGQLFVLDRRTGEPVVPVREQPAPAGVLPDDHPSTTQPYSAMPDLAGAPLRERDAWGISPIDQMWCRIQFRQSRYFGQYTPLGPQPTLVYPGIAGGIGWGGVAIDPVRGLLLASTIHIANRGHLIARTPAEQAAVTAQGDPGVDDPGFFPYPQKGTPYAATNASWLSALGVPCQRPPWGKLTAVDLVTRRIVWQRPLGDAKRNGPLGIPSLLPVAIGTPNQGGALTTAGGLTFIASAMDEEFRAYETETGRVLWHVDLPAGAHSGPATYIVNGQQFVVIAAGGHTLLGTRTGDYVLAYRLESAASD